MNRDEQRSRVQALPAALHLLDGRRSLFPSEPKGGAWVGVNDAGVSFALINWYSIARRVEGRAASRGDIVRVALPCVASVQTGAALAGWPLGRVRPFRLIGVFPGEEAVVEWRWNLEALEEARLPWAPGTWISSGYDEAGAQRSRGEVFRAALGRRSSGTLSWLRRLHRSHGEGASPYTHCMHREDAVTVSYTEIRVTRRLALLGYTPGAPCCTTPAPTLRLALRR